MILHDWLGWFVFEIIGGKLNPMSSGSNRLFLQRLPRWGKYKGESKGVIGGQIRKQVETGFIDWFFGGRGEAYLRVRRKRRFGGTSET